MDFSNAANALRANNIFPFLQLFDGRPQTFCGRDGDERFQVLDWFLNTTDDQAFGGGGNDFFDMGGGNDQVSGGSGRDVFQLLRGFFPGVPNNDTGNGGGGLDTLFCTSATAADGFKIDLRILTAQNTGDDLLTIAGFENITGGIGKDKFYGTNGMNQLLGMETNDTLDGLGGTDILDGGLGNDKLEGGGGNDDLTGGAGRDLFFFRSAFGTDTLRDFQKGVDGMVFSGLETGDLTFLDNGTNNVKLVTPLGTVALLSAAPATYEFEDLGLKFTF